MAVTTTQRIAALCLTALVAACNTLLDNETKLPRQLSHTTVPGGRDEPDTGSSACDAGACGCSSHPASEANCRDGLDDDCDDQADCADPDCAAQKCDNDPAFLCCAGTCVDTLTDENNFHGCDMQVERPASTKEDPARDGCTYIQYCMQPGTVCRAKDDCKINDDETAAECKRDVMAIPCDTYEPFWFCDRASENCRLLRL